MSTPTSSNRATRSRFRLVAVLAAVVLVGAVVVVVLRSIPDHRTTFLVDSSSAEGDLAPVAGAVGSAARNAGDDDALALRAFGGACGDPANTWLPVGTATGNGREIGEAAGKLRPVGDATLFSGILAAVDDFSGWYPFPGRLGNRVVVVSTHGSDACAEDQAAGLKAVEDRVAASGTHLDVRLVGYRVPADQREPLAKLAVATGSAEPEFVETAEDLGGTLTRLAVPVSSDAAKVGVPEPTTSTSSVPPPPPFRPFAYATATGVRLRTGPEAESVVLDQVSENSPGVGEPVWSADGKRLAWLRLSGDAGRTVVLHDVETGTRHTWTCVGCGVAFAGSRLIGTEASGTGWVLYPDTGGPPTPVEIPGLPPRPRGALEGFVTSSLVTSRSGRGYAVHAVDNGGAAGSTDTAYRVHEDLTATRAFQVDGDPRPSPLAVNEDGTRFACVTDGLTLVDTAKGTVVTGEDLDWRATTNPGAVAGLRFLPDGDAVAVTLVAPPAPPVQPGSWWNAVRPAAVTGHRFTNGAWTRSAQAEPLVEDVGGGWRATLTFSGIAGFSGAGELTLTEEGRSIVVEPNAVAILPAP
ncbi:hypothetical protein [Umezawaea sp.]|uniref:hypothetical protein n=1 Tax=Umezawaea sp. TaxID=1955258 RepID=UPI002ED235B6